MVRVCRVAKSELEIDESLGGHWHRLLAQPSFDCKQPNHVL